MVLFNVIVNTILSKFDYTEEEAYVLAIGDMHELIEKTDKKIYVHALNKYHKQHETKK